MHSPTCFPHPPHILSHSQSHYPVFTTLSFLSWLFVSVFIACLSRLEYKLQEGKSFVLLTIVSLVPEESPPASRYVHQMPVECCYMFMWISMVVYKMTYLYMWTAVSVYTLSFWAFKSGVLLQQRLLIFHLTSAQSTRLYSRPQASL